jgi:hypothetical protein
MLRGSGQMFGWFSRLSLRRIITQGTFIPEVDGFRFLAILIVIIAHAWGLFGTPAINRTLSLHFRREVVNGKVGVYLFLQLVDLFWRCHLQKTTFWMHGQLACCAISSGV